MNDKVPSAFGTLLFLTRDFTLAEESRLGLQEKHFSAMVSKITFLIRLDSWNFGRIFLWCWIL